MLCKKMVVSKGILHPCGQCLFCRINSKREWISRLLLEAASHPVNQFWTLTYEAENLPTCLAPQPEAGGNSGSDSGTDDPLGDRRQDFRPQDVDVRQLRPRPVMVAAGSQPGTLFKPDLARFFKRIRKNFGQFRYFAVGEYGELRGRPHYHVLAFGIEISQKSLAETWGMGHVHIGDVESASINYCVEYALKSQKSHDLIELRRLPEFSVMSTNPGIGAYAIGEFRKAILKSQPLPTGELLIPDSFRLLGKEYAVPRFIRNVLEDEGFLYAPKACRQYVGDKEVLSSLLARSPLARREFQKYEQLFDPVRSESYTVLAPAIDEAVVRQRILNSESRQRLFGKRHETL